MNDIIFALLTMTVRKYLDANHPGAKVSSSSNHHSPSPSLTLTTDPDH